MNSDVPVWIHDWRVPLPQYQPRVEAGFARRIQLPQHIGEEQNLMRLKIHGRRDRQIAFSCRLGPGARVVVGRNSARKSSR